MYVLENTEAKFDDLGFITESDESFIFHCKCRYFASGSGNVVDLEAKQEVKISFAIMMPLDTPNIKANALVEIRDKKGDVRLKSNIIRFERNQLHCRAWV